jgi:glutaminyl-peptide cyclotransferase
MRMYESVFRLGFIKRNKEFRFVYSYAIRISKIIFVLLFITGCGPETQLPPEVPKEKVETEAPKTPAISYTLVGTHPHDSTCFTQGLLFHEGKLFESSGAPDNLPKTRSLFGIVDRKTGKIEVKGEIDRNKYFGEGIAIVNGKLYQLTWLGQTGFIYDARNFKNMGTFGYMSREGWGLTSDGKNLIMSDGSNALTYLNPDNFQVVKTLVVSENNFAVDYLNELEYINGFIYANVYMTNLIVKIDPETGNVLGKMDLTAFTDEARKRYKGALEMNGIAYDSLAKTVLVTGKMWPTFYEIRIPL